MKPISEQFKELRANISDKKMSQQELADKLNMSRNFIAQIEMGAKMPSDRTIQDVCRIFSVNETWLRTGDGDMKAPDAKETFVARATIAMENAPEDSFKFQAMKYLSEMPPEAEKIAEDFLFSMVQAIRDTKEEKK